MNRYVVSVECEVKYADIVPEDCVEPVVKSCVSSVVALGSVVVAAVVVVVAVSTVVVVVGVSNVVSGAVR